MVDYNLGETLLKIDNVCLDYEGTSVLKNVSAEIKNITRPGITTGQIIGFLGPSGSGKTQLFRIIAGLNPPTSGKVTLLGKEEHVGAGEVGVVAQNYPLFEHRTVLSNLILAAKQKEKSTKVAKDKARELLSQFDLLDRALCYPAQLSGGQRQRCAILQQILCSEHFLLLDEPFSGLDLIMLEKTGKLLSKIAAMHDLNTIIVITHDITAAASISDHLWVLGKDRGADGVHVPGSRILKEYNLIERGLAWEPDIVTSPLLMDFVRDLKDEFRNLFEKRV